MPHRRLSEYDDIAPLVDSVSVPIAATSASPSVVVLGSSPEGDKKWMKKFVGQSTGRHVLLKAAYDGEEVVLKGFIMHEGEQRRGLDREISILSRLRNDSIICPRAIVEDVGSFDNPSLQVTVFIEYPYCKGGNLSVWLKAPVARKPWELQGVARQLLYGLMYLHDHGVVHKVC